MKSNQKGFSAVEIFLVIVIVGLLGAVGWFVYDRNNNKSTEITPTTSSATEQKEIVKETTETTNPYEGWKTGSFKYTKLSYKLPPNWQDISDNTIFQDGDTKYEEVKIKATDGFVLSMSVNDLPRGYESDPDNVVLEFKAIDSTHQWIIADNANGKVSRIYVGSGIKKTGEKILPVANVGRDGLNVELIGLYETELDSLTEFNQKQSVKEAKLVFESLYFN